MVYGDNPGYLGVRGVNKWGPVFTMPFITKNYCVLPMVVLICGALCGYASITVYAFSTKDYKFMRNGKAQHEMIDMRKPYLLKMRNIQQKIEPNPELAALLEEICRCRK